MNNSSRKLGICIVGCGEIAVAHAKAVQRISQKADLYFSSRSLTRAKEYCDKFGGQNAFEGIESTLSDSRIDIISLCLPHDQHHSTTLSSLRAGKHVLIEKPIACSLKEADEMISVAKKLKKKLAVAEVLKYSGTVQKAKELIQSGAIGNLRILISSQMINVTPRTWRKNSREMGGGALIDGGVHNIDALRTLGGKVIQVFAQSPAKSRNDMEGEDTTFVQLKFENGAIGEINYSWAVTGSPPMPYFQIHGTKGTIYDQNGLHLVTSEQPLIQINTRPSESCGYNWMMEDFVNAILNDREPMMTGEEGRADIAIALAAYESAKTGKIIKLD